MFSECFGLFDEQPRPFHGGSSFRRRIAGNMQKGCYECDLEFDFFATQGRSGRQGSNLVRARA